MASERILKARRSPAEVFYPESDGKPMAESDLHRDWMFTNISRLKRYYAGQRVYVSGNLLIYYVEDDPKRSVAPDAFVVKDCDPHRRGIFQIWQERRIPNFILETTSSTTRREDRDKKKTLYEQLKIPEYFLYDPLGDWLKPPLQGYRLANDRYVPVQSEADGTIKSEQMGIGFRLENGQLVMFETATAKRLLSDYEAAEEAQQQLAEAVAARKTLEEEIERLRSRKNR